MRHKATKALAGSIADNMLRHAKPSCRATWAAIRDYCDGATLGDFPPGELDVLADMVKRRLPTIPFSFDD